MQPQADILIVTVTEVETRAVLSAFRRATQSEAPTVTLKDRVYRDLGSLNGSRLYLALSEMGTSGRGASMQAIQKGIEALQPQAVIMVGIAFGMNEEKQTIGDILVSQQLMLYELQRAGPFCILPRGDRPHASPRLLNYFKSASVDWEGARVRFGLVLTGEKLVDSINYRTQLQEFESEAIGGEMEGAGLYAACEDARIDWILVKAICDWADGDKSKNKDDRQKLAAENAASFLVHAVRHAAYAPTTVGHSTIRSLRVPESENASHSPSEHASTQLTEGAPIFKQALQVGDICIPGSNNVVNIHPTQSLLRETPCEPPTAQPGNLWSSSKRRKLASEAAGATSEVLDWPSTLPSGANILRTEYQSLEKHLTDPEIDAIVVLGEAGSGKSALLATLGTAQKSSGKAVVGMRLDRLPRDARDDRDLQRYLNLSEPFVETVAALASDSAVLVLIDQLDALCDLMTERAGRLSLILNTVERLAEIDNVHVVLAIRPFEFQHDVRLRRVLAKELILSLPPWEDVAPHVSVADVDVSKISQELREELRRPQTLRTFLDLVAQGRDWSQLTTYHAMREALWQEQVEAGSNGARRRQLLFELARWMGQEEVLTRPLAQLDDWRSEIGLLDSAGWLRKVGTTANAGVTFRHQSLFEFVYARAVVASGGSLLEQVLQHQGLSIRRRVWSVLTYLRDASSEHYLREMDRFWNARNLRHHIKQLLIDFLGQVEKPTPKEVEMLRSAFHDANWRVPALIAAGRGRGWYEHLKDRELPRVMSSPDEAGYCAQLLSGVPPEASDGLLTLLETHWLSSAEGASCSAWVLSQRAVWTERAYRLAQHIASQLPFSETHIIEALILSAAATSPAEGITIFKYALTAEISRRVALMQSDPERPEPSRDVPAEYASWYADKRRRKQPIRDLIEGRSFWSQLRGLVDTAPNTFVEILWPVLEQALMSIAEVSLTHHSLRTELNWLGDETSEPIHLIDIFRMAVCKSATRDADRFFAFLHRVETSDLLTVHALLLDGLAEVAACYPDEVIRYFQHDHRRMLIGTGVKPGDAVLRFLLRIGPTLDISIQRQLAALFLKWTPSENSLSESNVRVRWYRMRFVREHRLTLLLCLEQDKLDSAQRAYIEQEQRALPGLHRPVLSGLRHARAKIVESPMKAAQMDRASDDEILNYLQTLPDDTATHHPRNSMQGGSVQASQELAELTSRDPARGLRIASKITSKTHQRPVGMAIEAAAKAGFSSVAIFQEIERCDGLGFDSPDYCTEVSRALEAIARRDEQQYLPAKQCQLLRSWLKPCTENTSQADYEDGKELTLRSILHEGGYGHTLSGGNYPILRALSVGLLKRERPDFDTWISILQEHVQRMENPRVWQSMAWDELRHLAKADRPRSVALLTQLVRRYPELLDVRCGLDLIAYYQKWLPPALTREWLESLSTRGNPWHAQAFGELLIVRASYQIDSSWTLDHIEQLVTAEELTNPVVAKARHGIAYMSASAMGEGFLREHAARWLLRLGETQQPAISAALLSVFEYGNPPQFNQDIDGIMQVLVRYPKHLLSASLNGLFDALHAYVVVAPSRVLAVANAILDSFQDLSIPRDRSVNIYAAELVDLALTLQNVPEWLDPGLDLFERLQRLNLYEVEQVLKEHEAQPANQAHRRPRRSLRRNVVRETT